MHNSYHTNFAIEKWFQLDLKVPERIIFTHEKLVTCHEILLTTTQRRAIESRHVYEAFPHWPNALTWLMHILSTIVGRLFGELLLIFHHIAFTSLTMDDINPHMHFNGENICLSGVGLMFLLITSQQYVRQMKKLLNYANVSCLWVDIVL